jgi:hypothetical protein
MPKGPSHEQVVSAQFDGAGNLTRVQVEDCRCTIGVNHDAAGNEVEDWQDLEPDAAESLSVYDAAEIWRSRGEDPDYMSGYSEDELRRAAEES